ncbi:MAG: 23S rRNA (guanosine(2251)-2'-O)-methyltransferase RlmB [Acidimicrobiales bacterium]
MSPTGRRRGPPTPRRATGGARGAGSRGGAGPRGGGSGPRGGAGSAGDGQRPAPQRSHGLGGEQVEGRQAVLELLRVGSRPVRELWIAEGQEPSPQLDAIERLAHRQKVRTLLVSRRRFDSAARTEGAQGVLARARALDEADLDELAGASGSPLLLVLDGVTDPHNLGSLLRSAAGAGVTGVVLGRHRAAHVTPTVTKVAAGAVEHVPISVVPGIPATLARLGGLDFTIVGLDADAARSLYDETLALDGPVALVLGAEGRGLGELSSKRCTTLVSIPRRGAIDSLNVSVAGAIACFEVARRRGTH